MSFARQKRLLAGWLALLAPLPLPFSELLEWPVLVAYLIAVAIFLRRAAADAPTWLPNWALNVLGLAYLPLLYLDFVVFFRGQGVRPLLHLGLFVLVVKLFAMQRESDKWHAFLAALFVFLAAMGTSVHPTVLLYMLAYMALTLLTLARFAYYHVLTSFGHREQEPAPFPLRGFLSATMLLVMIGAIPLFLVLPRLRTPYVMAGMAGGTTSAAGFSDEMTLDVASRVRDNAAIALRLVFDPPLTAEREIRMRAATYDRFEGHGWKASPRRRMSGGAGVFQVVRGRGVGSVHVWRQRLSSASLPLPEEAVDVRVRRTQLLIDEGGAVFSTDGFEGATIEYDAKLSTDAVHGGLPPALSADPGATLALDGITPQMTELAQTAMGQGTPRERAERLETYLSANYGYTLDFVGRDGNDPIGDFLFRYRTGHCELFASSMVLLLRSQGIPARLVTGFLGGEPNPIEDFFIIRQSNAHAWVEAYVGDQVGGWRTFDPTPPGGRPSTQSASFALLMQQAYDYVIFRWDRYVLTYGFYDQLQAFSQLRGLWLRFTRMLADRNAAPTPAVEGAAVPAAPEETVGDAMPAASSGWLLAAAIVIVVAGLLTFFWYRRPPLTAARAYTQLRRRLAARGMVVRDTTAPLALRAGVLAHFPAAAAPTERIVTLYCGESFGGQELDEEQRGELEAALRELPEVLKRTA